MNKLIKLMIIESKFNFNIDIENDFNKKSDISLSKQIVNTMSLKHAYELVNLDLPSGTIWYRYNLGVNSLLLDTAKDWYGDYYAWGETKPKKYYTDKTYKYYNGSSENITKYVKSDKYNKHEDDLLELLLEDDAAYLNLHIENSRFKMPTKKLCDELKKYTDSKWVENYQEIEGLNGRLLISKNNGNELFLPAAGIYEQNGLNNVFDGWFWTSSLCKTINFYSWFISIDNQCIGLNYNDRSIGCSIRPVLFENYNENINIKNNKEKLKSDNAISISINNNSKKQNIIGDASYIIDLDLPSGTKWYKYNLGVNTRKLINPKDWFGKYYAWGELEPKRMYNWDSYNYANNGNINKYINLTFGIIKADNLTLLQLEDDAAYLNLYVKNYKFKIPAKDLFEELIKYTTNEQVYDYQGIKDLNGILFKSETGKELFFPAGGAYKGGKVYGHSNNVFCWTSDLNIDLPIYAWAFNFTYVTLNGHLYQHNFGLTNINDRCEGYNIRPVLI